LNLVKLASEQKSSRAAFHDGHHATTARRAISRAHAPTTMTKNSPSALLPVDVAIPATLAVLTVAAAVWVSYFRNRKQIGIDEEGSSVVGASGDLESGNGGTRAKFLAKRMAEQTKWPQVEVENGPMEMLSKVSVSATVGGAPSRAALKRELSDTPDKPGATVDTVLKIDVNDANASYEMQLEQLPNCYYREQHVAFSTWSIKATMSTANSNNRDSNSSSDGRPTLHLPGTSIVDESDHRGATMM